MPSVEKGGGSRNSHEMRLSVMMGVSLIISPSRQTYTSNIGIWRGLIPMYACMFWVIFDDDSTYFRCVKDTRFHDSHMIYVGQS